MPCRSGSPHGVLVAGPALSLSPAVAVAVELWPATGTGASFRNTIAVKSTAARPITSRNRLLISYLVLLLNCFREEMQIQFVFPAPGASRRQGTRINCPPEPRRDLRG